MSRSLIGLLVALTATTALVVGCSRSQQIEAPSSSAPPHDPVASARRSDKLAPASEKPTTRQKKDPTMDNSMKPAGAKTFAGGVPVADADAAWFKTHAKGPKGRALFRLPVAMRFDSPAKLQITKAAIGADTAALSSGIWVDLDDTAMGVGVLQQLRGLCPKEADTCVVWLHAHWGRNVPMPKMPPMPGMPPQPDEAIAVRAIDGLVTSASGAEVSVAQ